MAGNGAGTQSSGGGKKMDFKPVTYDVNEIAPDAPEGEWLCSIPRGKIKVQPTKEDHFPMMIIPLRLDKTEDDTEAHTKALGTELSLMIVFFDDSKPRAARMGKLKLQQLCDAAEVDREAVPTDIRSEEDFADFIAALEGKKFPIWTKHVIRKDTQETVVEVLLRKPGQLSAASSSDDEDDDKPAKGKAAAKKASRR